MGKPTTNPPAYAIARVDHALRLATVLQLEGAPTVAEAAERLAWRARRPTGCCRCSSIATSPPRAPTGPTARDRSSSSRPTRDLPPPGSAPPRSRPSATRRRPRGVGERGGARRRDREVHRFGRVAAGPPGRLPGGHSLPGAPDNRGLMQLTDPDPHEFAPGYKTSNGRTTPPDLARLERNLAAIRRQGFAVTRGDCPHWAAYLAGSRCRFPQRLPTWLPLP